MKIKYIEKNFKGDRLGLIDTINSVIDEYTNDGYKLTLRQLYYQLVARGYIENSQKSYKNTGNLINDARLAGLIDWEAIEDRTRNLQSLSHWSSPKGVIEAVAWSYRRDVWRNQNYHVEVWVEKEALANVVGRVAESLDVSYFCCRGYVSQSEMWSAAQRFRSYENVGKTCVIVHLGDHDPSGIDMSRDIQERLEMFGVRELVFRRIALNRDQIDLYNPPPNPAKITDTRSTAYIREHGDESWELDALEPKVLHDLITDAVTEYMNEAEVTRVKKLMESERAVMNSVAENWDTIFEKYSR